MARRRSAETIALELGGGLTRNAVLGKVARLGLSEGRPGDAAHGEVTCDHAGPDGVYPILPERTRDRSPSGVVDHGPVRRVRDAHEPTAGIDQSATPQVIAHLPPIGRAEGVDDDPAAIEQERDRTVRLPVAGRRHIGAHARLVEISAEDRHDLAQAHRKYPRVRRLAVPSLPTIR